MKVDNLRVHWRYSIIPVLRNKRKKNPDAYETELTECFVTGEITSGKEEITLAAGTATCSLFEKANKDKGRKESLRKALLNFPSADHGSMRSTAEHLQFRKDQKAFRAKFWEAYRTMTVVPRWNLKKKPQD